LFRNAIAVWLIAHVVGFFMGPMLFVQVAYVLATLFLVSPMLIPAIELWRNADDPARSTPLPAPVEWRP
jgi:hypothetical protein